MEKPTGSPQPRKRHRILKRIGIVLGIIVVVLVAAVVAVNVIVRAVYAPFYAEAEPTFPLPGISQGFVPQDLDHFAETDQWLFSGYMDDGSPSPVYRSSPSSATVRLTMAAPDGTAYTGHGSGIASTADHVFLTRENGYLVFSAAEVANAPDGATVRAIGEVDLDFTPAFLNIENGTLYVGNFFYPEKYETPDEHRIATAEGSQNPAVMYAYPANASDPYGFSEQAACVYSIPAMVQGMATTPAGQMVFSTSYGLRSSNLLFYDTGLLAQDGTFQADGRDVPLYVFDTRSLVGAMEAPPMTEGIDSYEGRIYIAEESASNKYLFGKLYGAGIVYAMKPL